MKRMQDGPLEANITITLLLSQTVIRFLEQLLGHSSMTQIFVQTASIQQGQ